MDNITHEVRLAHWKSIIEECLARPEGQSAKQWLAERGIPEKTYYYWQRRVQQETYALIKRTDAPTAKISPIAQPVAFAEIPFVPEQNSAQVFAPDIVIRKGQTVLEMSNSVSDRLLEKLMEYYQLGINARDLTETELLNGYANMKTLGTYNVVQLRNLDEVQSMKITLTLREKGAYDTTLPIADYIKADSVVVKNHSGNAVAKSESSTEKEYVYVVNTPADVMSYDISKQLYTIPVTFSVYTGAALEARNKDYSIYMSQMQVELYDAADAGGTVIGGSSVKDHVIYTNAKLLTEVIEN